MACSACAKRRKKLLEKLAAKRAQRQTLQAAAIGAVLTVTEKVGNAIGLSGEESEDGSVQHPDNGSAPSGAEPDR